VIRPETTVLVKSPQGSLIQLNDVIGSIASCEDNSRRPPESPTVRFVPP
jgi:hypothetical protein